MSKLIQAFVLFLFIFSAESALAHRPYLKKQAVIYDNQGQQYIIETWNGDGIFFVDPYVVQMRDQRGYIVARGGWSLIFLCPSLEYCWSLGLFPIKFNSDEINQNRKSILAKAHHSSPRVNLSKKSL